MWPYTKSYALSLGGPSEKSATENVKPATHLAILYADRGEFDRQRKSQAIDADTPGDFFADRGDVALQHCSCDKIA